MVTSLRAALSVVMLAGFYLLAVGLIGGLAALAVWMWREHPGAAAGKISYVVGALAVGLVVALWKVLRAKPGPPPGLPVSVQQAPELWRQVDELARQVGTRSPDEIRVVADVNAAVSEDARLMGLVGGRRYLFIGLPLAHAFTVGQLRSVLAHELGHYSHRHTRVGALAHRGRLTIVQTIQQIGPGSLAGWVFTGYARLYVLVEQAVSRRQELEADAASVRVAGRQTAMSALREVPVVAAAWNFYVNRYVGPGWEAGFAPRDIFGGFPQLLAARRDELGALRDQAPPAERSRWDSHPPIAQRIAVMAGMPEPASVTVDDRPAVSLLPALGALSRDLQAAEVAVDGRTLLPWHEFTATAMVTAGQRDADVLFRAAARLAGVPAGSLGLVLDLVGAGRAAELAAAAQPHGDPADAMESLGGALAAAIAVAAVRSGSAEWRHEWARTPRLTGPDGEFLAVGEIAVLASDPATLDQARDRLRRLGIDVNAAVQQSSEASTVGARLLGGLANMKSGDDWYDVYVLNSGLVLVPASRKTDHGRQRLGAQLDQAGSVSALADKYGLLSYEQIVAARIVKQTPLRVEITLHNGTVIPLQHAWSGEALAKDSADLLRAALEPFTRAQA